MRDLSMETKFKVGDRITLDMSVMKNKTQNTGLIPGEIYTVAKIRDGDNIYISEKITYRWWYDWRFKSAFISTKAELEEMLSHEL